ncbi:Cytosolic carboxypeptidase 1 [Amphibalanus amphitrite]|uniref:Cytosolic carboxypeptidase 1 n=1 Tax=Amphibalanus amphitrite TaxID=1232801 RepID=A0A6A4WWG5_AMPAM|nr:Cytosolic carboxypeptidase 1 [Amphibalanus amphitrite]
MKTVRVDQESLQLCRDSMYCHRSTVPRIMSGEGQQLLQLMQQLVRSSSDNDIRAAATKLSNTVLAAGCSGCRSVCDLFLAVLTSDLCFRLLGLPGVSDTQSLVHLTNVLAECLKDKECTGEVCRRLTDSGGTEVVVASLRSLGPASQQYQTVTALYTILYKIGKKDPRFAVRLRLCGGLKVLLRRLQDNAQKCRICVPALQCVKLAAGNDQNVSVLGRGEAVEHLRRLVPHLWNMSGLKQQLTLECTARLIRNRMNRRRLLKENVIPRLLPLLQPRHKLEKKTQYNVQKAVLNIVFALADLKPGREALMEARVCEAMQSFLRSCPPAERHDRLFCRAANTVLRCVAKWSLPVARLESPVSFTAPAAARATADGKGGNHDSYINITMHDLCS